LLDNEAEQHDNWWLTSLREIAHPAAASGDIADGMALCLDRAKGDSFMVLTSCGKEMLGGSPLEQNQAGFHAISVVV
jgi:hypothetical protein